MIFTALISGLMLFITGFFFLIPFDLPAMPVAITAALDLILTYLAPAVNVLRYVYNPVFFVAMILVAIALVNFHYVYSMFTWVMRKIPLINYH